MNSFKGIKLGMDPAKYGMRSCLQKMSSAALIIELNHFIKVSYVRPGAVLSMTDQRGFPMSHNGLIKTP